MSLMRAVWLRWSRPKLVMLSSPQGSLKPLTARRSRCGRASTGTPTLLAMDTLWDYLGFTSIAAILLAVVGYLIRTLVGHQLQRSLVAFENELARSSSHADAKLRHALSESLTAANVRYSELQRHRMTLLLELHQLFIEAQSDVATLTDSIHWGEPDFDSLARSASVKALQFKSKALFSSPLFDNKTQEVLRECRKKLEEIVTQATLNYTSFIRGKGDPILTQGHTKNAKINEMVRVDLQQLRERFAGQISLLAGVKDGLTTQPISGPN